MNKCIRGLEVAVYMQGMGGYYIGTYDEEGPNCKISQGSYSKRATAQKQLDNLSFNDERGHAIQMCNGGRGCQIHEVLEDGLDSNESLNK